MSGLGEFLSVQAPLVAAMVEEGWRHVPGNALPRDDVDPFVEDEVVAALIRLNPAIGEDRERVHEVLRQLRTLPLAAVDSGLVEANRDFADWLRGNRTHEYVGTKGSVPVRLIDFDDLSNNTYIVSDEVRYGTPGDAARFDVVLWVNGFPLVVGELKTPLVARTSWMRGASDLVDTYQVERPGFFVPNALVFATEGKEFRYAGVGTPVQMWQTWGPVKEKPKLADVIEAATALCHPRVLLDMLADFTLFETPDNDDGIASLHKIVARYTQYQAVNLIVGRVMDPTRRKGLIYHTQGSGKTLAMVFAAGKLLRDESLNNPTIVLVADRVQLVQQMWDQFRTTSMPRLIVPATAGDLQRLLKKDQRGLIFTTVHKFADAPVLNERENVVVMVDEAHRTQEGDLGIAMRRALPNANLFAFTGTPIADEDRNTFATFGDESDPGQALHTYGTDESIRDGMTVPIHVAPRKVEFTLEKDALDEAFEALAEAEGLSEQEQDVLARRAGKASTFFANPERVTAVCEDIVEHFYSTVDPLGMKAQVVVIDRAACVAYYEELDRLLAKRYEAQVANVADGDGPPVRDEVAVVMTVGTAKGDPPEWGEHRLTEAEETALLKRFRTHGDPLKFLVCTSKLGTGFNAPIEGVMYLDKPLKDHTLFQTITRANRTWRNPETGKDKRYGIIVDYVGLGSAFGKAMAPANPEAAQREIETDKLIETFHDQLRLTMLRFAGIDVIKVTPQTLIDAQARMPRPADEDDFAANYGVLEGIWEALSPDERLAAYREQYRFLSQVYTSVQPSTGSHDMLWHRLGAKTLDLVHQHMDDIAVTNSSMVVVADAQTVQTLIDEGLIQEPTELEGKTADDIIDSIAARLKRRLELSGDEAHPIYTSLAERLDRLRERAIAAAEQSIEWLREAFLLATDLTVAEKAEEAAGKRGLDLLPDPRIGALTQIFREYAPEDAPKLVERVVTDIDTIVREVRYDGWAATQEGDRIVRREVRKVLGKYKMHQAPGLFDRAYAYIAEHY